MLLHQTALAKIDTSVRPTSAPTLLPLATVAVVLPAVAVAVVADC